MYIIYRFYLKMYARWKPHSPFNRVVHFLYGHEPLPTETK